MWLQNLDGNILLFLQEYARTPVLDKIMNAVTSMGDKGLLAVLICIILLFSRKYKKAGCIAGISLIMEFILVNLVLKNAVGRIRPYDMVEGLVCITRMPHDFSFPSGHTGSSFAVAGAILLNMPKKYGITAIVIAAAIGFSRLYLGVHYPTDVLAGAVIGMATAILAGVLVSWRPVRDRGL